MIGDVGYIVDADFDSDGDVDAADASSRPSLNMTLPVYDGEISDASTIDNVFGYCGYVFNQTDKLYTVRYRHYYPAIGRWIERDPLGYHDGMNRYCYTYGNPVLYTDPSGLIVPDEDRDPDWNPVTGRPRPASPPPYVPSPSPKPAKVPKYNDPSRKDDGYKPKSQFHERHGAYYAYTVMCKDGTSRKYSGYIFNLRALLGKIMASQGACCCISKFTISTHQSGGKIYCRWGENDITTDELAETLKLCSGAQLDLNMCNSCDLANKIIDQNPGVRRVRIECTDGFNWHYPELDVNIPGGDGEDIIVTPGHRWDPNHPRCPLCRP